MYNSNKNFIWWHGFVEDVDDPEKLGRCRVRIFGIHTHEKEKIPTESLPWAVPMMPYSSASASGVGRSPTGILPGSWVVGFFRDGEECQQPMILGSYGGINKLEGITQKDSSKGFNDPDGKMPRDPYIDKPDTNKLAREETEGTVIEKKNNDLDTNNPTALGGEWSEPPSPYAAKYPKNHVFESESGHVFEIDDTPDKERLHEYHKKGTFREVHPDGTVVEKTIGDEFIIIRKNNNISIYGNMNINVGNTMKVYTGKNMDIQIGGNARIHVAKNATVQTDGNFLHKIKGTTKIISEGPMEIVAPRIDLNPNGVSPKSNDPGYTLNKNCTKSTVEKETDKVVLEFDDGSTLECDGSREINCTSGWKPARDITENDEIINLDNRFPNEIPISQEEKNIINQNLNTEGFNPQQSNSMIENFTSQGYGANEISSITEDFSAKNFTPEQTTNMCGNLLNQNYEQSEILSCTNTLGYFGNSNSEINNFSNQINDSAIDYETFSQMFEDINSLGVSDNTINEFIKRISENGFDGVETLASELDISSNTFKDIQEKINEKKKLSNFNSLYNF